MATTKANSTPSPSPQKEIPGSQSKTHTQWPGPHGPWRQKKPADSAQITTHRASQTCRTLRMQLSSLWPSESIPRAVLAVPRGSSHSPTFAESILVHRLSHDGTQPRALTAVCPLSPAKLQAPWWLLVSSLS